MRTLDAAAPTVPAHPIPPDQPSASWPAVPVFALEYLPQGDTWDDIDRDVVWNNPAKVWDDPLTAAGYTNVWCDLAGCEIIHGEPDEHDLLAPSRCTLTLHDPTGKYRRRTPDGRLTFYAPGRRLKTGVTIGGVWWWTFSGRVATWHELPGDLIEIVAYSSTAALAADPGRDWSPGVAGDRLGQRAAAIVSASGVPVTVRADTGTNTFVVPPAEPTPALELLQQAAWSDGGVVASDADDALIVRDRNWRAGRADNPAPPRMFTDTECDVGDVIVTEVEYAYDDDWLAANVTLSTDAGLVAQASNTSELIDPTLRYTHPDVDLWRTQPEGDTLAAYIAGVRGVLRQAVALMRIYLHDPRLASWQKAIDTRVGDRIVWRHSDEYVDQTVLVDVFVIVHTIRHLVTPETWIVEYETTPAVAATSTTFLNWDITPYRWDDPDPAADWR